MKVNHKTLTSALFALLMFSVAVSGGCGGGGSGTPVSQDTITLPDGFSAEYASPNLTLGSPDDPSSSDVFISGDSNGDDEFGDGQQVDQFTLLSKTTWNIESVTVNANNGRTTCQIQGENSKRTKTVTFFTWSSGSGQGGTLAWAYDTIDPDDPEDTKKKPIGNEALTIQFQGAEFFNKKVHTAPMVRPGNFTATNEYTFQASVGTGTETITLSLNPGAKTPNRMTITNEFSANNKAYTCTVELTRLDNFFILDQTDWKIKDVQVFGLVKDASGNYVYGDPKNYVITSDLYKMTKQTITLRPRVRDGRNFLKYTYGRAEDYLLTVEFEDKTLNQKLIAPFLRYGSGFFADGEQDGYKLFRGRLNKSDIPGDEVLRVSDYGPLANIVIDNSVCYLDKNNPDDQHHYWTRLILEPTYIAPEY